MEIYKEELYHHGILGQRWGDRNGPPYPLTYSKHSAAERKKNAKKILSTYSNKERKEYKKERKNVLAITKIANDLRDSYNSQNKRNERVLAKSKKLSEKTIEKTNSKLYGNVASTSNAIEFQKNFINKYGSLAVSDLLSSKDYAKFITSDSTARQLNLK